MVGSTVRITNTRYPNLNREVPVTKAQTNAFTTPYQRPGGEIVQSWTYWPKAAETAMIDENTVALLDEGSEWLRIEVIG